MAQTNTPHPAKLSPEAAIERLKAGNQRFVTGMAEHPHASGRRLSQAGVEDQGDHAFATVLTCSDSRVPVELIFDAGVMDIFVIRVAGNVCNVDEVGSIEYGLAHVHTPVLVVLGHTQCGAVTTVTRRVLGEALDLEENIPPLVAPIEPVVRRAMAAHPEVSGLDILPYAIEENVWAAIGALFKTSPATRKLVEAGTARVVGAIYDVSTGEVSWLPESGTAEQLAAAGADQHDIG